MFLTYHYGQPMATTYQCLLPSFDLTTSGTAYIRCNWVLMQHLLLQTRRGQAQSSNPDHLQYQVFPRCPWRSPRYWRPREQHQWLPQTWRLPLSARRSDSARRTYGYVMSTSLQTKKSSSFSLTLFRTYTSSSRWINLPVTRAGKKPHSDISTIGIELSFPWN